MKKLLWMLAAILTICGTCVMTSCSNDDDTVVENPLENKLEGVWYTAYEASGSLENPNGDGVIQYTHAVETYRFSHEGANVWNRYFFFGENDEPITDLGGGSNGLGAFSYTSKDDGTITVTLTNTSQVQEKNRDDYAPLTRTLRLADDKLLTKGLGDKDVVFERDTVELATLFGQWNVMLHGGSGSTTNPKELDVDVDDVKYTILNDETTGLGSTLWKVVHSPKKSLMIQTAVKEMEDRGLVILPAEAKTRATGAVTAGPTGYRSIDYTYESIDEQGKPITLSARAIWGGYKIFDYFLEKRPQFVLLAPHYTISDDFECPTSGRSIEDMMMSGNRLLIIPDYEGFGVTKDRVQPYIIHDLCAQQCIDALKAGYKIFRDKASIPLMDDFTLSVAGVSQGGGNALAIHKWLDTHADFADRWRFDFSYCAAGPYSPRITFEKYFEQKKLVYPVVMPVVIKAMIASYPDILGKWKEEDFFSDSYNAKKDVIDLMVNSKEYTSDEINDYIFDMYPHEGEKDIKSRKEIWLTDILSADALNRESELCKALFVCLDKNDLTKGWTPIHPIHLYHGKGDQIVSYANAEAVMKAFPDKTDLSSPSMNDDHIGTSLQWLMSIVFNTWRINY